MKRLLVTVAVIMTPAFSSAESITPPDMAKPAFTSQGTRVDGNATEYTGVSAVRDGADGRSGSATIRELRVEGGTIDDLDLIGPDCAPSADGRKVRITGKGLESFGDGDVSDESSPRERFAADSFSLEATAGDNCLFPDSSEASGVTMSAADGAVLTARTANMTMKHKASAIVTMFGITASKDGSDATGSAESLSLSLDIEKPEAPETGNISVTADLTGATSGGSKKGDVRIGFSCSPENLSFAASSDLPGFLVMQSGVDAVGGCQDPNALKLVSGSLSVTEGAGFAEAARAGISLALSDTTGSVPPIVRSGLEMKKAEIEAVLGRIEAGDVKVTLKPEAPVGIDQIMGAAIMGESAVMKVIGFSAE